MMRPPLALGTVVEPYGKVGAILWLSGERYYHLIDDDGGVAMMPADMIEDMMTDPLCLPAPPREE